MQHFYIIFLPKSMGLVGSTPEIPHAYTTDGHPSIYLADYLNNHLLLVSVGIIGTADTIIFSYFSGGCAGQMADDLTMSSTGSFTHWRSTETSENAEINMLFLTKIVKKTKYII